MNKDLLNKYSESRECRYKNEHYSVRDNGAIYRYSRKSKRKRKYDDIWTFGKRNNNGYMEIGQERVHRIVAFAFLGEPPTPQHVVDHKDTNRSNNRPENLRWVTRLENVLNNPITRARIEMVCGSIEAFISNPSILREHEMIDPNFSWMRTVSPEEAQVSLARQTDWAKEKSIPQNGHIGEWIFTPQHKGNRWINSKELSNVPSEGSAMKESNKFTESLTPNATQDWHTPTEFPLCPCNTVDKPLVSYLKNLKKGDLITKNEYTTHFINDFALCNDNNLLVISTYAKEGLKKFSMISVTFENGKYIHKGTSFFEEQGAQKAFILAQQREWDGGDGIDDYC